MVSLAFSTPIPVSFYIVCDNLKTLFLVWWESTPSYSFESPSWPQILTLRCNCNSENKKKSNVAWSGV